MIRDDPLDPREKPVISIEPVKHLLWLLSDPSRSANDQAPKVASFRSYLTKWKTDFRRPLDQAMRVRSRVDRTHRPKELRNSLHTSESVLQWEFGFDLPVVSCVIHLRYQNQRTPSHGSEARRGLGSQLCLALRYH